MNEVCKPSKRLRNWHRRASAPPGLKAWVRAMAAGKMIGLDPGDSAIARRWLASKAGR